MIGVSSCSHEDQAALLNDRISCLKTLDTPVTSAKGIAHCDSFLAMYRQETLNVEHNKAEIFDVAVVVSKVQ